MKTRILAEILERELNNWGMIGVGLVSTLLESGHLKENSPTSYALGKFVLRAIGDNPKGCNRWKWELIRVKGTRTCMYCGSRALAKQPFHDRVEFTCGTAYDLNKDRPLRGHMCLVNSPITGGPDEHV